MKITILPLALAGSILALTSCSSHYAAIDENTPGASFEKGVPGGTVVETQDITATVTHVDVPNRKVTLTGKDGQKTTVKCGADITNFDQIKVGDRVNGVVTAELTVAMAGADAPLPGNAAALVAVAPADTAPGVVMMAETQQYTATVKTIDLKRGLVTLHFPDGEDRTFAARKDVDLSQRKVGEAVVFRVTVATAISLKRQ
jgi:Cu/Ag efflux protein CusF